MMRTIATLGPIGHFRPGPGTWGSAAAILLAWAIHALGGFGLFFAATLAVTGLGWWAIDYSYGPLLVHLLHYRAA